MKKYLFVTFLFEFCIGNVINVLNENNEIIIIANNEDHINYGLSYPVTYEINIPSNSTNLNAYKKYKNSQNWDLIDKKNTDDFFNGIEAVRYDYDESIAYTSVKFSIISDTIYVKITDETNTSVITSFNKISRYYDNRKSVVTVTGDDWADWNNENFIQACQNFRSLNLWYSVAIITNLSQSTWNDIQNQLDLGMIEAVSHSRTHPFVPYYDVESEVLGSKQDIIDNLNLVNHNRSGPNEYVYAWIAPYGEYSTQIDTMTSNGGYLVSRLFYWYDNDYSEWDNELYKFDPVGASIELGNADYWGSFDIDELNSTFENVVNAQEIYHLTTHPNILQWNENFTWTHLEYISNRKDIWYVGFGHLYLYRFISKSSQESSLDIMKSHLPSSSNIKIHQNYPNPFNPITFIKYELEMEGPVKITIYDMMGRLIKTLLNGSQTAGHKNIKWNATNDKNEAVSAGLYLYTIESGNNIQTMKMILLK